MYTCIQVVTVVKLFCFGAYTVVHAHCECPSLRKTKVYFVKLSIYTGRNAKVLKNCPFIKWWRKGWRCNVQGAPSLLPVHHRVTIQLVERTNPSAYLLTPVSPCSNPCPAHLLSLHCGWYPHHPRLPKENDLLYLLWIWSVHGNSES